MEGIDVRHIHVLEFPKPLLWTDRSLEFFLEEMPSESRRMNNDVYDVFIKEVNAGQDYSPEEAFNLAYYECVRISLAKYPESRDIIDVLELDIQHNQSHVNYGFTDLIMNMVWAMLYSTNTARRFSDKLHTYLVNSKKLKFWFREFFTPNDIIHAIYPYDEKEEPRYNLKFAPCPKEMNYKSTNGEWCKLTIGYKEHLIEELLMLWPEDKRETIRKSIMDEKARQLKNFEKFAKKHVVEIIDEPESHLHINLKESIIDQSVEDEINQLKRECDEWKAKHAKLEKTLQARTDELDKWHNLFEEETKRTVMVDSLEEELDRWKKKCEEFEGNLSNALYEVKRLKEDNNNFQKYLGTPKIVLTNNSNFARVVQAMVSARYFKRANGDETNATEVGGMLLKIFGVSNTWKSVLQKAFSREYPLKTFDDLRDAGQKYWEGRAGLTKEIRKKGKK